MRGGVALVILAEVLFAQIPQPKPKGAIKVSVRDTTGAPVAEISVGIRLDVASHNMIVAGVTDVSFTQSADLTDETGGFARADLPAGPYSVWITRDRITVASREIKLDADQEMTVDFVIPSNASISGRVVNQEKEPEIDAFVWLLKPEYQNGMLTQTVIGPKVTGEDGTYQFDTGLETNRRYYVLVDRTPRMRSCRRKRRTRKIADRSRRRPIFLRRRASIRPRR